MWRRMPEIWRGKKRRFMNKRLDNPPNPPLVKGGWGDLICNNHVIGWVGATSACLHEAFRRRQVAQKAPLHGTLPHINFQLNLSLVI